MSIDATIAFLEGYAERNGMVFAMGPTYDGEFYAAMYEEDGFYNIQEVVAASDMLQAARRLETKLREIGDVK
jgi:hypothetical protein